MERSRLARLPNRPLNIPMYQSGATRKTREEISAAPVDTSRIQVIALNQCTRMTATWCFLIW